MKHYYIGNDKNGMELEIGDICKFELKIGTEQKEYEGMIIYDEDTFSYAFEMKDDNFPIILMQKAYLFTINKIINVTCTVNEEYEFYRKVYENFKISYPTPSL